MIVDFRKKSKEKQGETSLRDLNVAGIQAAYLLLEILIDDFEEKGLEFQGLEGEDLINFVFASSLSYTAAAFFRRMVDASAGPHKLGKAEVVVMAQRSISSFLDEDELLDVLLNSPLLRRLKRLADKGDDT